MIKEDYVSFETAKLLKEKGFDGDTSSCYILEDGTHHIMSDEVAQNEWYDSQDSNEHGHLIQAPTHQMAMKWLREVHNIDIDIDAAVGMLGVKVYVPLISTYKPLKDAPSKLRQIKRGIYYKDDKGVIPALQHFDSYEEAVEAALKYSLENLI